MESLVQFVMMNVLDVKVVEIIVLNAQMINIWMEIPVFNVYIPV